MDDKQPLTRKKHCKSLIMLSVLMLINGFSYANQSLDDATLSEQTDRLQKVTPEVISQVKSGLELNLEQQHQAQQKLAQVNAKQIKKELLEANAASDYEIKRKTDPETLMRVEKHEYVPAKPSNVSYTLEYSNKNVQIGSHIK